MESGMECLIYEVIHTRKKRLTLNIQSDSIQAMYSSMYYFHTLTSVNCYSDYSDFHTLFLYIILTVKLLS